MTDTPETDEAYSKNDMANVQTSGEIAHNRYLLSCRLERARNIAIAERDELKHLIAAIAARFGDENILHRMNEICQ